MFQQLYNPLGVVGFSDYCKRHSDLAGAAKIVKMLNDLYTAFDVLTDPDRNPDVYKASLRKDIEYFSYYFVFMSFNTSIFTRNEDVLS